MRFVVAGVLAVIALAILLNGGIHSGSAATARVRLVEHHCSRAGDGGLLVNAQLANDGATAKVQATAYALLRDRTVATPDLSLNASPWQYDRAIPAHQSDFFEAEVPSKPGDRVAGCGVKLGAGAPTGVTYEGDGYGNR
jgi:hypothetical protein